MNGVELRDSLKRNPFEPFRLVGLTTAFVGLTSDPAQTFYERSVKIDLLHIVRLESLQAAAKPHANGPG